MIAKNWKRILLFVVIIACLFNITTKLVYKAPLKQELETSAQYMQEQKAIEMRTK